MHHRAALQLMFMRLSGCRALFLYGIKLEPGDWACQVLAARRRPSHTPAYEVLHATASATAAKLESMRSEAEKALLEVICWPHGSALPHSSTGLARQTGL